MFENIIGMFFRILPWNLKGKNRLARFIFGFLNKNKPFLIKNNLNHEFFVPNIQEPIAFSLFINGVYEPDVLDLIKSNSNQDDIVVDVGANIGCFVIPVSKHLNKGGKIIAFEPSFFVCDILKENIKRNSIDNAELVNSAVSNTSGTISFFEAPDTIFGMGGLAGMGAISKEVKVPCVTLDDYFSSENKNISILKIDVEGFEVLVLKGAEKLLINNRIKMIIFEFLDWAEKRVPNHKVGDAQRYLRSLGFEIWRLADYQKGLAPLTQVTQLE